MKARARRVVNTHSPKFWALQGVPPADYVGGNEVRLLTGGDELFPAMVQAIAAAEREVWMATYIFHDDHASQRVEQALAQAALRGVQVHVVVDGFGALQTLALIQPRLLQAGVKLEVFRPLDRWWAWFQPGALRRLHQKLLAVDNRVAFVGGINIIDDRHDLNHGWTDAPRLDYAVELRGPLVDSVRLTTRAIWARAALGHAWRDELRSTMRGVAPVDETMAHTRALWRRLGRRTLPRHAPDTMAPMRAAFVVRDNLSQRRAIERSFVQAIASAQRTVDIAVPYFYPGRVFRRTLRQAARRGVRVRLLLQGKVDYRIAAYAARALYDELRLHGVHIFEYTPAFLHAKVAVVDEDWATVGSSNIDPLSLLLNLEANVMVHDPGFARSLTAALDRAFAVSSEVQGQPERAGWRGMLQRGVVAWLAHLYLRLAGISGRY
jgi:cardiolipin synthase A/B